MVGETFSEENEQRYVEIDRPFDGTEKPVKKAPVALPGGVNSI